MDPRSGELYRLHAQQGERAGDAISLTEARERAADGTEEERIKSLLGAIEGGEEEDRPLVAVEENVVQKLRLGEKEIRRRKQRRR